MFYHISGEKLYLCRLEIVLQMEFKFNLLKKIQLRILEMSMIFSKICVLFQQE